MKLKSTLRVFNEAEVQAGPGVVQGQTLKPLAGDDAHSSERITVRLASFKPGTLEAPSLAFDWGESSPVQPLWGDGLT